MKKFIFLLLLLSFGMVMISGLVSAADKSSNGDNEVYYDYVNDQYITNLKTIDKDGNMTDLSFEDYMADVKAAKEFEKEREKQMKKAAKDNSSSDEMDSAITAYSNPGVYYRYYEEAAGQFKGRAYAVTNPFTCPYNAAGCSPTYSVSETKYTNWDASVNLASERSAVSAGINASWGHSATNSTSYRLDLNPGTTGYVTVAPYYNYSGGTLRQYYDGVHVNSDYVYNEFPARLYSDVLKWHVYGVVY